MTTFYLKDYTPFPWSIESVQMHVELDHQNTLVTAETVYRRKPDSQPNQPLELDAGKIELESAAINGIALTPAEYKIENHKLVIHPKHDEFTLKTVCRIHPKKNTALQGLYSCGDLLVTQCEAEGFRNICYFPDRPDCSSVFTVTLTADKAAFPVLLANGNLVSTSENGNTHSATWHDPFPKPSYLFALVAGKLVHTQDQFETMTGKKVTLQVFSEEVHRSRHSFALRSLKEAMKWDEKTYGLEYDLDRFMIVAVDYFNAGAMENKGLNIFNSQVILVDEELTTDDEKINVESIVAHEYFHNWTGNRVTLKNWFNLTLKEGLTVLRDQEFTTDVRLGSVKRIEDAQIIRSVQFAEDAGALAHPPVPEAYADMNNFYTVTVYNKGAEIFRMLRTILGRETFIRGVKAYLQKYDGGSATVEGILEVMAEVSGKFPADFINWFYQPGTPLVEVKPLFDEATATLRITLSQSNPISEKHGKTKPMVIPLKMGFIGAASGRPIQPKTADSKYREELFILSEKKSVLEFSGFSEKPLLSINRNFSAPVRIRHDISPAELALAAKGDPDDYVRRESIKQLILNELKRAEAQPEKFILDPTLCEVMTEVLSNRNSNDTFTAYCLHFPSYQELFSDRQNIDPDSLFKAFNRVFEACFRPMEGRLSELFTELSAAKPNADETKRFAARSLKNTLLAILTRLNPGSPLMAVKQYEAADNITDKLAAMVQAVKFNHSDRSAVKEDYYRRYKHYMPRFYTWLSAVAAMESDAVFEEIDEATGRPEFKYENPTCIYYLMGSFTRPSIKFHCASGKGYRLLKDKVIAVDRINPQVAANALAKKFFIASFLEPKRREMCLGYIHEILNTPGISTSVREIMERIVGEITPS